MISYHILQSLITARQIFRTEFDSETLLQMSLAVFVRGKASSNSQSLKLRLNFIVFCSLSKKTKKTSCQQLSRNLIVFCSLSKETNKTSCQQLSMPQSIVHKILRTRLIFKSFTGKPLHQMKPDKNKFTTYMLWLFIFLTLRQRNFLQPQQ